MWVYFGTNEEKNDIPIHLKAERFGEVKSLAFLKAHILTGCDMTSRLGGKTTVLRVNMKLHLEYFGEGSLSKEHYTKLENI